MLELIKILMHFLQNPSQSSRFTHSGFRFQPKNTCLFHIIRWWDKWKRRVTKQQSRPLVFLSPLLLLLIRCQLLPRLTVCLDDGLRAILHNVGVLPGHCYCANRLPGLPGLNKRLLRLFSGCKETMRRWWLCNGCAGEMTATVNASQCFKRVF